MHMMALRCCVCGFAEVGHSLFAMQRQQSDSTLSQTSVRVEVQYSVQQGVVLQHFHSKLIFIYAVRLFGICFDGLTCMIGCRLR